MPSTAWYYQTRSEFVSEDTSRVVASMAGEATRDGWHIDPTQHQEWETSVRILQGQLKNGSDERIAILRSALEDPRLEDVHNVVLEYNVKRRGLRIDAVLLAAGALIVIEFKRSAISTIDRDQVMNYCVNLREFHELTRTECEAGRLTIVPILALTSAEPDSPELTVAGTLDRPWQSIVSRPLVCGPTTLSDAIAQAIACRTGASAIKGRDWVDSRFSPSSSILDAAISLYGQHDVSAIRDHAVPVERIRACTDEIRSEIEWAKANDQPHLVIVSGTPGSGKTLVGLDVAFDYRYRKNAVFVTGNAPLVDVLHKALKNSYTKRRRSGALEVPSGYAKSNAVRLIENADFKIVKAHKFLEKRGDQLTSADGGIVIFDEAQRTYEKGRQVLGEKLVDHEADLIMDSLEQSDDAPVIVALLGHNQAINRGERGARAWFEAAERRGWTVAISDETLELDELLSHKRWRQSPLRRPLRRGHLTQSLRFYRNAGLEAWAHAVLSDHVDTAKNIAAELGREGHPVLLSRDLDKAKKWVRSSRVGEERVGMIGSAQGRRLAAEGLFVEQKPDIANWMIAPTDDIRSSNMLETIQNQYQIQGLELDYTLVAWDADLRRGDNGWEAWKIRGAGWVRDSALDVAQNGYRVLLTRARKGMVIFVPRGDRSGEDRTRDGKIYDAIADKLVEFGAQALK